MFLKLKPLHQQVIFITDATSGIGLITIHRAVEQGAKVFMVAKYNVELQKVQDEMRNNGYDTDFFVADVAEEDQLQFAVDQCIKTFGQIDTFVNNAGILMDGKILKTDMNKTKRLFDSHFWGIVNGCKVAIPVMRKSGGVIINIGDVLSNLALPIQGLRSASKHAIKGYSDAIRRDLLAEKAPLHITLIMPSGVETSAEIVAKAVLKCAVRPTRELVIGSLAIKYINVGPFRNSSAKKELIEHQRLVKGGAVITGLALLLFRRFRLSNQVQNVTKSVRFLPF